MRAPLRLEGESWKMCFYGSERHRQTIQQGRGSRAKGPTSYGTQIMGNEKLARASPDLKSLAFKLFPYWHNFYILTLLPTPGHWSLLCCLVAACQVCLASQITLAGYKRLPFAFQHTFHFIHSMQCQGEADSTRLLLREGSWTWQLPDVQFGIEKADTACVALPAADISTPTFYFKSE